MAITIYSSVRNAGRGVTEMCSVWNPLGRNKLMSIEHWWNNTDGKKYCEKNLSQFCFVHHRFHMDWVGIEPVPPG
jgi:hypothetical protein